MHANQLPVDQSFASFDDGPTEYEIDISLPVEDAPAPSSQFMGFEGRQAESFKSLAVMVRKLQLTVEALTLELVVAHRETNEARAAAERALTASQSSCCPWRR